jgi:hypothetical protein
MLQSATTPYKWLLAVALSVGLIAGQAQASGGEHGDEHAKHLKQHIDQYTKDVHWMIKQVDEVVDTYAKQGAAAANPAKLADDWESVEIHPAIESNLISLYATIWEGIYDVRGAIEKQQPVAEVRKQRDILAQRLWQALGAVKMAAKVQAAQQSAAANQASAASDKAVGPLATVDEIKENLDKVVAEFTGKEYDEAVELVLQTYDSRFEGIEGALIEQDADLVADLEKDFNVTLPKAIKAKGSTESVKKVVEAMKAKLDKAKTLLAKAEKNKPDVF